MQSDNENFNLDRLIQHNPSAARAVIRDIDSKMFQLQMAILKSISEYKSLYHKPDSTQDALFDTSFTVLVSMAVRTFTFTPLPIKLLLVMASYYTSRNIYNVATNRNYSEDRKIYIDILSSQADVLFKAQLYTENVLSVKAKDNNFIEPGIIIRAVLADIWQLANQSSSVTVTMGQGYLKKEISVPGLRHYITGRSKFADILQKHILSNSDLFPENCPLPLCFRLSQITNYDATSDTFLPRVEIIDEDGNIKDSATAVIKQGIFRQPVYNAQQALQNSNSMKLLTYK